MSMIKGSQSTQFVAVILFEWLRFHLQFPWNFNAKKLTEIAEYFLTVSAI